MKLVLTIPFEGNDVEETDLEVFTVEAKTVIKEECGGLIIKVGRPISEEEPYILRMFSISVSAFSVELVEDKS